MQDENIFTIIEEDAEIDIIEPVVPVSEQNTPVGFPLKDCNLEIFDSVISLEMSKS